MPHQAPEPRTHQLNNNTAPSVPSDRFEVMSSTITADGFAMEWLSDHARCVHDEHSAGVTP